MLWSAFCPKQHSHVTHLVFGSASMCIVITYLAHDWEGGSKDKETRRASLGMCYKPGSEDILSWLLQGGAQKCHVSGYKKSHCCSSEPKACVTGSKDCSFKPLPKHTEAVKQTETQEWRKQTENQAGCCSVVKQCP